MARPRSEDKRTKRLAAPANERELADFVAACSAVNMEPADTIRKLVVAFNEAVAQDGYIIQPIRIAGHTDRKK